MRVRFLPALALALASSGALAAPIPESPRPEARPGSGAAALAPIGQVRPAPRPEVAAVPEVTRAAMSAAALLLPEAPARLRPLARPAAMPAAAVEVATVAASPVPEARPRSLRMPAVVPVRALPVAGGPEVIVQAAFRAPQSTGPVTGRKGGLCGDPEILGKEIPPILGKAKGCGLDDGVSVISVAGVALTQPASIDCTTARALKDWVEGGVKPAVGRKGGGVAALQIAASYSCRPRNNQKGARMSEHGRGRAVDVAAIILADGTSLSVLKGWGTKAAGKTLAASRKAACGPFNTVLGPGSDRFHADHFHLDTARGRGAYCR